MAEGRSKVSIRVFNTDYSGADSLLNSQFNQLRYAIALAVATERERCAQVAEHLNGWGSAKKGKERAAELAAHIAKVIRAPE
jgi:hypothetical protein